MPSINDYLIGFATVGGLGGVAAMYQAIQGAKKDRADSSNDQARASIEAQQAIASIAASQQAELNKDEQQLRADLLTIFQVQQSQIKALNEQQNNLKTTYESQIATLIESHEATKKLYQDRIDGINEKYKQLQAEQDSLLRLVEAQATQIQQVTAITLERDHWRNQALALAGQLNDMAARIDRLQDHIKKQDVVIAQLGGQVVPYNEESEAEAAGPRLNTTIGDSTNEES